MLQVIKLVQNNLGFSRCFASAAATNKVAVVLSGSGVYDGSEIHEASATVVHLSRLNYQPVFYAPDKPQMHAIDHTKGEELKDQRNVLIESARIARGNIQSIQSLNVKEVAAVIFPGGFGAAKNLSNFATEGVNLSVDENVARLVRELRQNNIPIGFMCIAPIIAAKLIPGVKVTLGQDSGTQWPHAGAVAAARELGALIQLKNVDEVCVDQENSVVSTPAFMFDGQYHQIFDGIGLLVKSIDVLIKKKA